jgi:YD repeat-containing protein
LTEAKVFTWSPSKKGNLTTVDYASSTNVTFGYDALNRKTNMVDAVGTTAYAYTAGGQLWTEDGPFADDTVTNIYNNRLRTGLSLKQPTGSWTNGGGSGDHITEKWKIVNYTSLTRFRNDGQPGWNHYLLIDASFSGSGCVCNYTAISGPAAGTTLSIKGRFGKLCFRCQ